MDRIKCKRDWKVTEKAKSEEVNTIEEVLKQNEENDNQQVVPYKEEEKEKQEKKQMHINHTWINQRVF